MILRDPRKHRPAARACLILVILLSSLGGLARAEAPTVPADAAAVDTALILAVDTSSSVDDERFRLQMDGIARALEDDAVVDTILGGPRGVIAILVLSWSDHSGVALPWTLIASSADARRAALRIRRLERKGGEYTCLARMLRYADETLLGSIPFSRLKTVIDVSGDGVDNCEETGSLEAARDRVVSRGAVINGLPILLDGGLVGEGAYRAPGAGLKLLVPPDQRERMTLDTWFDRHVIGGFGAFSIAANGYKDFARAMRSKFVIEISHDRSPPSAARLRRTVHIGALLHFDVAAHGKMSSISNAPMTD